MDNESQNSNPVTDKKEGMDPPERRNFLRKSLIGATPLILTAVARPVLGNQCTLSGMMSGNLSAPGEQVTCIGLSPGYWMTHPENWLPPYDPGVPQQNQGNGKDAPETVGGTLFRIPFAYRDPHFVVPSGKPEPSMMDVLRMGGNEDSEQLGAHAVGALLNAVYFATQAGLSFGYTADEIISYWDQGHGPHGMNLKEFYAALIRHPNGV